MRKLKYIFLVLVVLFTLASCDLGGNSSGSPKISVKALKDTIELKDTEVNTYDYKTLFEIKSDETTIEVLDEYLDLSSLKETAGSYKITCTYEKKKATVTVNVKETVYDVLLKVEEITINQLQVKDYDFLSLFTTTIDGVSVPITEDMIENNVKDVTGTYTFIVTFKNVSKTLTVHVIETHEAEVVPSYLVLELTISQIQNFDYTKLFSLYVDYKAEKVTNEMLDVTSLNSPTVGNTYDVIFDYTLYNIHLTKTVQIRIVEEEEITISSKNIIVYPNGEYVDLTKLFEIKKGNQVIPVTLDMITGNIDYSIIGVNTITLNYEGHTATSNVEVRRGVIINYAKSDTITITKGTNKNTYAFINDFVIVINGVVFNNISDKYLEYSDVDFNTPGVYTVKLTIPFNDKELGIQGVKFTYVEKTITYVVVENTYDVKLNSKTVELETGTTEYDPFDNINLKINNRNQTLTTIKDYVDIITCYAEVLSDEIDFNKVGPQDVKVALYVNGIDNDPIYVEFTVTIKANVEITSTNKVIFKGQTIYTKNLFTIVENDKNVEVTNDLVSGKVDSFVPGVYEIELNYKGIIKTSRVVVLDDTLLGEYQTRQTTIAYADTSDDGSGEGYGDGTTPDDDVVYNPVYKLKNLKITDDYQVIFNSLEGEIVDAASPTEFTVKTGTNLHYFHYIDGIIVIEPDNSSKLTYSDSRRSIIYFSSDMYQIGKYYMINSGSEYVLSNTTTGYSIDLFKIKNKETSVEMWYALKTHLIDKTSADTVYTLTWGEATIPSDYNFEIQTDDAPAVIGSVTLKGETYQFIMQDKKIGKTTKTSSEKKYANMTFTGLVDGENATLLVSQYEGFTLVVNGTKVFTLNTNEVSNLKNGGIDYATDTVFLYEYEDSIYSYKFILNVNNKTFEVEEKTQLFGKYENENTYIFFDGYGTGVVNFNTKSYYTTQFKYQVKNSDVKITYINTNPTFTYESESTFYLDTFKNVLTAKSFMNGQANGESFENVEILDGAIVRIKSYVVGADADSIARTELLSNIEIITKDGILSDAEKIKCIDVSKIKFSKAGFYQFTITIPVNGVDVVSYYACEIIDAVYKNNPIVGIYDSGVIFDANTLSIDKYGRVVLTCSNIIFNGNITINDDYSFVIKANNEERGKVTVTGRMIQNGIILVTCGGAISFTDYFTLGESSVSGTDKFVLRRIIVSGAYTYILADSTSTIGKIVDVEMISETITKVTKGNEEYFVKIINWNNVKSGLVLADEYRGTYTLEGSSDIEVDGFGGIKVGSMAGTYTLTNDIITVIIGLDAKVYRLNNKTYTYEKLNIAIDNSLVSGKTFTASYSFICSGLFYTAETKFIFGKNGVVTVVSTSDDHDGGSESCSEDIYDPTFGSKKGINGTYSITGNELTIKVNGETIIFEITNIINVNEIVLIQTSVDPSSHGYFAVNTIFELN